ncbi:translation initiation factor eif-2bgamma [Chaetoceros tenuissimus]|uniref:Translation initiation factor eIF2B subunit epsilon n=1 Tax=Chaetoceros tenuissimus TaxID=426638 RepID=A0AAD3CMH3_9STRA|nr:translation initiation factor eif-2bgamma [Chaetoceros tenuissimus]
MGGGDDNKRESKLQAVLLADSFLNTFQPITLDKVTPKVLCPLNNVALLDYGIEFLAGAGVEELFVFCATSGDTVEEYVQKSNWTSSINVKCVKDSSVTNAGDALRYLDKLNVIRSDSQADPFILMTGDVITNVDIVPAIEEHKRRYKKDNTAIMTVLMKEVGGWGVEEDQNGEIISHSSSIRSVSDDLFIALNTASPAGNRILSYDSNPGNTSSTKIPTSFFAANAQIELRNDLLDTGIYICSPDVLARFSDEFDFLEISKFISNIVAEEEEGLQNKIFASILKSNEYAARIHDLRTYHAVSRDLLKRWCYPIVPDNQPTGYDKIYRYEMQRHMMYVEQKGKEKLGRCTSLKGPGMIGSFSKVGNETSIHGTVIGNSCLIGDGVSITDAHIWDNVTIEDGATICEAVLCNDCVIKKGAVIPKGCVIGRGCVIDENIELPEFSRITIFEDKDDDDDFSDFGDDSSSSSDSSSDGSNSESSDDSIEENKKKVLPVLKSGILGVNGKGRLWKANYEDFEVFDEDSDVDSDDEEDVEKRTKLIIEAQSIGFDPTSVFSQRKQSQLEEDGFSDDEADDNKSEDDSEGGFKDDWNLDEDGTLITGRQEGVNVIEDLKNICLEHEVTTPIENLRIELNSYKFSQNASFGDCVTGAMLAIFERLDLKAGTGAAGLVTSFKAELKHWGELFEKLCHTVDEEKSLIKAIETAAISGGVVGDVLSKEPSFRLVLQTLHTEDIISDEAVLAWAASASEADDENPRKKLFTQQQTQDFIEWVEEDSDDDSDDDSSSSGSESDGDSD